jgi:hypothetical protein
MMINNDRESSHRRLYSKIIDTVKGHLTNRYSENLKPGLVSLIDSENFKHYSTKIPATAYDLLMK